MLDFRAARLYNREQEARKENGTDMVGFFGGCGGDLSAFITLVPALISGIAALALFTDYTKERITVWQNPEAYKLTGGWQTLQGLMSIGSGGLFGVGFGKSVMKHCYVSEPANDMIFAILCASRTYPFEFSATTERDLSKTELRYSRCRISSASCARCFFAPSISQ